MARTSGRLTVLAVQHAKKPGMLADGDGLRHLKDLQYMANFGQVPCCPPL